MRESNSRCAAQKPGEIQAQLDVNLQWHRLAVARIALAEHPEAALAQRAAQHFLGELLDGPTLREQNVSHRLAVAVALAGDRSGRDDTILDLSVLERGDRWFQRFQLEDTPVCHSHDLDGGPPARIRDGWGPHIQGPAAGGASDRKSAPDKQAAHESDARESSLAPHTQPPRATGTPRRSSILGEASRVCQPVSEQGWGQIGDRSGVSRRSAK